MTFTTRSDVRLIIRTMTGSRMPLLISVRPRNAAVTDASTSSAVISSTHVEVE